MGNEIGGPGRNDRPPKWLLFDYGGVVQHLLDDDLVVTLADRLSANRQQFKSYFLKHIAAVQSGMLTERAFLAGFLETTVEEVPRGAEHWFVEPFAGQPMLHEGVVDMLDALAARKMNLALLSNTIPTHAAFNRSHEGYRWFGADVFLSCEIGAVKPDVRAFDLVLEKLSTPPDEILLIEDQQANVVAGASRGLRTIHHESACMLPRRLAEQLRLHAIPI